MKFSALLSSCEVYLSQISNAIEISRLENGVLFISENMPGVESVALGVWADAGSADELTSEYGLAHFLEHMLFKGTEQRTPFQLAEAIEDVGGQLNAYTERETTHLFVRVLSEHTALAVELMADMVCHSTLPQDEIDRERQVIIEEIRKYESLPEERIHDLFMSALWQGGSLGHTILGSESNIADVTREALFACRANNFNADRLLITAAGKLSHDELVDRFDRAFALLPGQHNIQRSYIDGKTIPLLIDVADEEQVNFCWGVRTFPADDERNYPLAMLDSTLGGSTTSRLFQEIREKRGLVYDISSFAAGFRHTGLFCASGAACKESFPQVITLMRSEIEKIRTRGISSKELARAKEQIKAGLALSMESTMERMRTLATHYLTWGTIYPLPYLIERMNKVTDDEVNAVIEEVLDIGKWSFSAIGPLDESAVASLLPSPSCIESLP